MANRAETDDFPEFPFPPYPQQRRFMQALYTGLDAGGVALLESPTGTGKTISMICSALKWLEDTRQRDVEQQAQAQRAAAQSMCTGDDPDWLQAAALQHVAQVADATAPEVTLQQRRARKKARKKQHLEAPALLELSTAPRSSARKAPKDTSAGDLQDMLLEETGSPGAQPSPWDGLSDSDTDTQGRKDKSKPGLEDSAAAGKTQIIFCSRTHSQLSQFVAELRRTSFPDRLSLAALASRKVLCIHPEVRQLGSSNLINQTCLDMQQSKGSAKVGTQRKRSQSSRSQSCGGGVAQGRCPHLQYEGPVLEEWQDEVLSAPADVEDLVALGTELGVCPYYGSRSLVAAADLVLAPYAVVLAEESRRAVGLKLQGNVLIIDEAHNLLDALNSLHSHSITGDDLAAASAMLAGYWQRVGACLGPRNARHVQLLQRVLTTLRQVVAAPAGPAGQPVSTEPAHTVTTANSFLFQHQLEDINMFELLAWVQDSKLLVKLASYSRWLSTSDQDLPTDQQTTDTSSPQQPGPQPGTHKQSVSRRQQQQQQGSKSDLPGSTAGSGSSRTAHPSVPQQRSERMASLQAVVGFLSALTNSDVDGRILSQQGRVVEGPTAVQSSGSLKYVLLSAATHFGKVLSSCRAVVLASGTLAPVEGLATQLFSTSGLQWVPDISAPPPNPNHKDNHNTSRLTQPSYEPARLLATLIQTALQPHAPGGHLQPWAPGGCTSGRSCQSTVTTCTVPEHNCGLRAPTNANCMAPATSCTAGTATSTSARGPVMSGPGGAGKQGGVDSGVRPLLHFACSHVVPADHVSVLVAGQGPSGVDLDMRHAHRATPKVMDEVGRLLANLSRVVPAGLVVFVPSFAYLTQLTDHWTKTGMMQTLQSKKAVFTEPRTAAEVEAVLSQYTAAATGKPTHLGQSSTSPSANVSSPGGSAAVSGALLLAVVGGKLSEGINFNDDLGRCVVVLGLPYANPTCPELRERQAYLDRASAAAAAHAATGSQATHAAAGGKENQQAGLQPGCSSVKPQDRPVARPTLTGKQLYENMCMNAVNQCVGRVVRHRNDHAVVILVDARYVQPGISCTSRTVQNNHAAMSSALACTPPHGVSNSKLLPSGGLQTVDVAGSNGGCEGEQRRLARYQQTASPVSKLPQWMLASLDTARTDFPGVYSKVVQFFKRQKSAA